MRLCYACYGTTSAHGVGASTTLELLALTIVNTYVAKALGVSIFATVIECASRALFVCTFTLLGDRAIRTPVSMPLPSLVLVHLSIPIFALLLTSKTLLEGSCLREDGPMGLAYYGLSRSRPF